MNRKYIITSSAWDGEVELIYSDEMLESKDGNMLLVMLDVRRAELSEPQHIWFLKSCREFSEFEPKIKSAPGVVIAEVAIEVTFDIFWKRYKAPYNSKNKKALLAWNRLPVSEQIKAFNYIAKYERGIQSWQTRQYAETYLNSDLWNN
jgi:hypothetical protein